MNGLASTTLHGRAASTAARQTTSRHRGRHRTPRRPRHRHCRFHSPPVCSEQTIWLVCTRGYGISAIIMKIYPLHSSCDNFFNLCIRIFIVSNTLGNFSSNRIRTSTCPLAQNPQKIFIRESWTLFCWKDLWPPKEENPVVWYSHQCALASHHSRCTSTANKNNPSVLCKSTRSHFHHFSSSCLPPPRKPQSYSRQGEETTRGEQPPLV
jgi:hypothetical protein